MLHSWAQWLLLLISRLIWKYLHFLVKRCEEFESFKSHCCPICHCAWRNSEDENKILSVEDACKSDFLSRQMVTLLNGRPCVSCFPSSSVKTENKWTQSLDQVTGSLTSGGRKMEREGDGIRDVRAQKQREQQLELIYLKSIYATCCVCVDWITNDTTSTSLSDVDVLTPLPLKGIPVLTMLFEYKRVQRWPPCGHHLQFRFFFFSLVSECALNASASASASITEHLVHQSVREEGGSMFSSLMRKWFHLNLPHKSLPQSPKTLTHSFCFAMVEHIFHRAAVVD